MFTSKETKAGRNFSFVCESSLRKGFCIMKKKIISLTLALMFTAVGLVSCASKNATEDFYDVSMGGNFKAEADYDYNYAVRDDVATEEMWEEKAESESYDGAISAGTSKPESPEKESGRKIIYSSNYDIRTKEYDKSIAALNSLCTKYGAYFENSNTYGGYDGMERSSNYTIRVPVKNYTAFVGEAGSIGVIVSSSENNRDVTEQYFDTEARLESARLREERVLEILANANKLDDVLALERELADIRYEIESYTGALRKLDSLVSYSTVTMSIRETSDAIKVTPTVLTFGERISKGFSSGINDFVDSFQDFVVFLSYNFIGTIIWLVIIAVVIVIVVRARKKAKKVRSMRMQAMQNANTNGAENTQSGENKDKQ